jgi:hypothetical protein
VEGVSSFCSSARVLQRGEAALVLYQQHRRHLSCQNGLPGMNNDPLASQGFQLQEWGLIPFSVNPGIRSNSRNTFFGLNSEN